MSGYRWLWVGWVGIFLVLEFTAILRGRFQDTLSEFVWSLEDILPGKTSWEWSATHFFVFAFLVWLLLHLAFGYFR
jgi:hypothetical protein